jgi:hypothetical protein
VKTQARENLRLLTDQCHRWGVVSRLSLPVDAFTQQPLLSIQGRLSALRRLEIATYPVAAASNHREVDITCFSDTGLLREFRLANDTIENPSDAVLNLSLPWSNLERVEFYAINGDQGGQLHQTLVNSLPSNLKILKCSLMSQPSFPPTLGSATGSLVTLPMLQVFDFRGERQPGQFLARLTPILDRLILPSLVELHLTGAFESYDRLAPSVKAMIVRSGCSGSLKRLSLCGFRSTNPLMFRETLSLTPNITHLSLPLHSFSTILDLHAEEPPGVFLPNLNSLTVCNNRYFETRGIDVADLMVMVRSRTVDLSSLADGNQLQVLEEVHILAALTYLRKLRSDWMVLESSESEWSRCNDLAALATEAEGSITQNCWQKTSGATMKQGQALDTTMRKMEMVDLRRYSNVEVLIVRLIISFTFTTGPSAHLS